MGEGSLGFPAQDAATHDPNAKKAVEDGCVKSGNLLADWMDKCLEFLPRQVGI